MKQTLMRRRLIINIIDGILAICFMIVSLIIAIALSFGFVALVVYVLSWAFCFTFTWKLAVVCWIISVTISAIVNKNK
jgi:hypothetical protein